MTVDETSYLSYAAQSYYHMLRSHTIACAEQCAFAEQYACAGCINFQHLILPKSSYDERDITLLMHDPRFLQDFICALKIFTKVSKCPGTFSGTSRLVPRSTFMGYIVEMYGFVYPNLLQVFADSTPITAPIFACLTYSLTTLPDTLFL